jgi:hypothetical protein
MSVQPTQQVCPSAPAGQAHHLIPRRVDFPMLVCVYCRKTEQQLRDAVPSTDEEEGGDQAGGQTGGPEQAHPDHPEQHDEAQDEQLGQTLHPDLLEPKSTSPKAGFGDHIRRDRGVGNGWVRKPYDPRMARLGMPELTWVYRKEVADGVLNVLTSPDEGAGFHLSISHQVDGRPGRYPHWDEITEARDRFTPARLTFVMFLPPKDEYVNAHSTTFHLWSVPGEYCQHCHGEPPKGTTCPRCGTSTR